MVQYYDEHWLKKICALKFVNVQSFLLYFHVFKVALKLDVQFKPFYLSLNNIFTKFYYMIHENHKEKYYLGFGCTHTKIDIIKNFLNYKFI